MKDEVAVLAGFSLIFMEDDKGSVALGTEITNTDPNLLKEYLESGDWVMLNAAINVVKKHSAKIENEILKEIKAVMNY